MYIQTDNFTVFNDPCNSHVYLLWKCLLHISYITASNWTIDISIKFGLKQQVVEVLSAYRVSYN